MDKKIVAVIENHFDQIWRRCFRRDFVWNGQRFVSYSDIEKIYIDKNLELYENDPSYKFQIETPCVVETYVENNPEKKELLKELYKNKVLKTTNTGYVILDSNVVGEEVIIKNYLVSEDFFDKYAGETPKIANRSDAFGNSAQLPQILRSFGAEYVMDISYNPYDDDVWVGLDKSPIFVRPRGNIGVGGDYSKYPPCSKCKGFGKIGEEVCNTCGGLGIDRSAEKYWNNVRLSKDLCGGGAIRVGGEEFMPNPDTPMQIAKIREERGVDISLGHWDYLLEHFRKEIEQTNRNDFSGLKVRKSPEFNPNTTGGYTTRIKIKQNLCDAENKLLACETLEAMQYITGKETRSYDKAWRNLLLCGFHDSAMATVVDQGYYEIIDMFSDIQEDVYKKHLCKPDGDTVCLFNPTSSVFNGVYESEDGRVALVNGLEPYSFSTVKFEPSPICIEGAPEDIIAPIQSVLTAKSEEIASEDGESFCIENEFYTIEADKSGIKKITHKQYGVISETTDDIRPCEWIIESDFGSPWARLAPAFNTTPLKNRTKLIGIERGEKYVRICYKTRMWFNYTNIPTYSYVDWSLMLINDYERIKIDADAYWATSDKRLMISFPLAIENSRDIYGIPGGWLEREPYEPDYSQNGADGDYPAFRYAEVENENKSIAVFNRGTPAYKILPASKGKIMYVSVLRSPTNPTYLHEPKSYTMTEYDGMRDEGMHSFSFEFAAYGTNIAKSSVVKDAEQFSRPPLCVKEAMQHIEFPIVTQGSASVTHVKIAEDGNGIVVRVTEYGGIDEKVEIFVPSWVKNIYVTDMPEKKASPLEIRRTIKLSLRAFEIASLRFVK